MITNFTNTFLLFPHIDHAPQQGTIPGTALNHCDKNSMSHTFLGHYSHKFGTLHRGAEDGGEKFIFQIAKT